VALLLRCYTPSAGTITLDGFDVTTLQPLWLRRQIAVVSQTLKPSTLNP
jgi:ABC-type multidrug transport system fused ATPase/permease subunit